MLEGIGVGGQSVADDRLHPALPEGAARLLVAQDFLQPHHFLRQAGEPRLRGVDQRQSLVQRAQIGERRAGRGLQPLIDAMGEE